MITAEGVLLYSLDEGLVFDPTDLGAEVTPAAVHAAAARGAWLRAFLLALRLSQPQLLHHVLLSTPPQQVLLATSQSQSAATLPLSEAAALGITRVTRADCSGISAVQLLTHCISY